MENFRWLQPPLSGALQELPGRPGASRADLQVRANIRLEMIVKREEFIPGGTLEEGKYKDKNRGEPGRRLLREANDASACR